MREIEDRYERGLELLKQVGGEGYDGPINTLRELAPDLARFTVEFGYGDVMSRPTLHLPTRQLCTVGALAALGNARPQLEYHINGALNVGCRAALGTARPQLKVHISAALHVGSSQAQIVEVVEQMAVYAGFPAALNGISAIREVLAERGTR